MHSLYFSLLVIAKFLSKKNGINIKYTQEIRLKIFLPILPRFCSDILFVYNKNKAGTNLS